MTLLLHIVRFGAALCAIVFLGIGAYLALGEPEGFDGGLQKVLTGSQDLLLRHNEARMLLRGENIYQLMLDNKLQERATSLLGQGHLLGADYFPSTLLPVLLMAGLSFSVVKALWLLINLISTVVFVQTICWMMGDRLPSAANQGLMVCLWICSIPFWSCLAMGQASIFSVAFTLAAFRMDLSGRYLLAGLLLALGVFKYTLIWPLVLFLFILQLRWRCLLVGGGIHLVVHLALCRIIQANPVTVFADVLRGNEKVFNFSNMLTIWLPFRSWNRMFPDFMLPAQWFGALLLLMLLGGLIWLWLRRKTYDRRHLLVWSAALTLLSVLTVTSRIFAHMYTLPLLLLACEPGSASFTAFQRGRLIAYTLYLGYVPSGVDDLGLPGPVMHLLLLLFNTVIATLAVELGILLFRLDRIARLRSAHG